MDGRVAMAGKALLTLGLVGPINVLNVVEWARRFRENGNGRPDERTGNRLGPAVSLDIPDPELTEVTYNINALLQALDGINPPGLDTIEPLPIILPPLAS